MATVNTESLDVVDFHSHILPCVDHGSDSLETSLKQVEYARLNGVSRIIATPHFYPHKHLIDDFLKRREQGYQVLSNAISSSDVEIRIGAELLVCENVFRMPGIEKLCINGTNTLLLELPMVKLEIRHYNMVKDVIKAGFDVVIAHVDRYAPKFIDSLTDLGIGFQLNASAMRRLIKTSRLTKWLKERRIYALGSDVHGNLPTAYNNFAFAKSKLSDYLGDIKNHSDRIWSASTKYEF